MKKSIIAVRTVALLVVIFATGACAGVHIREGVRNADAYFDRALRDIHELQVRDPGRRGGVSQICILVHDRHSAELVDIAAPLWLAETCLDLGLDAAEHERDYGLSERYNIDLNAFKDLRHFGPGLLIDIEEEETRVLVWLR